MQFWHWFAEDRMHFFLPSRQEIHARTALLRLSKGTCGRCLFDERVGGKDMLEAVNLVSLVMRRVYGKLKLALFVAKAPPGCHVTESQLGCEN